METFNLYHSTRPDKLYMMKFINPNTNRQKTIHFGQKNAEQFPIHKSKTKKNLYLKRHGKMNEDWTRDGRYSSGFYSRWILWNYDDLNKSIRDTEKRFKIKIINNLNNDSNEKNKLIEKVKNYKHSAYKSMMLAKLGLSKPTTDKNKGNLQNWTNARWENLTAKLTDGDKFYNCGERGKNQKLLNLPSVCRPSVIIDSNTPKPLSNQLSNDQIQKSIKIKQKGLRINWKEI